MACRGLERARAGIEVNLAAPSPRAKVASGADDPGQFIEDFCNWQDNAAYRAVIAGLVARGAQAVILGCTEIMLLVQPEDSAVPLFDTTTLHATAAVDWALTPAATG